MRHNAFYRRLAIGQRLVTAGTTCSGLICEKGGSENVSNGLVICAVGLKEMALYRAFAM